ncbi:MAG: hypothetical protein KAT77_04615 [Nanoarchaeota archaeon]|nr:hypothetical protein [Nanoarchaeota archaeon]
MAKKKRKKSSKKVRRKSKKQKKEPKILAYASIVLGVVGSIVVVADALALIMTQYINGPLLIFTYLASMVVFTIGLLGVALATADLMVFPKSELARKAMYFNLVVMSITFVLILFGIF